MKAEHSDVLVVGGGVAGCVAAKAALDAGKKVTVIFPHGGASELSAGAVDVAGVVPGACPHICESYAEGVQMLAESFPGHPYRTSASSLEAGLGTLSALAQAGGYALHGFAGRNVWLPNIMGTFSVEALAPDALVDSVAEKSENVLVVGFKGNVNFNAHSAAMSYLKYQKKLDLGARYVSATLELDGLGDRRKLSDGELADYFDTDAGLAELADKLTTFCSNNRCRFDKILLAPVLGYVRTSEILAKLREVCGCKVGEVLTTGNSVTGFRMTRALYKGLEKAGAVLVRCGRVTELHADDNGVSVACTLGITDQYHPGVPVQYTGAAAVLATGGFVGGGLEARHTKVWVSLLNEELGQVQAGQLNRNAVSGAGQDVLRMGTAANEDLSVKNEACCSRVFACGEVLGGCNTASERSGAGVAAATAYKAGTNAAAKA